MIAMMLLQAASVASGAGQGELIVTGQRLEGSGAALRACVEQHCSPVADISATIAHADNQFLVGDYKGARRTLVAARERNRRYAAEQPVAVSELLRVDAFVASIIGEADYARVATIGSVSALKAGLAPDDERIAVQRLEVAAIFARQGRGRTAINMLDAIADRAAERGWTRLEAEARLRAAAFYAARSAEAPELLAETRSRLARLRSLSAPAARPYIDAAVLIDARVAQLSGDDGALALARAKAVTARVDRAILVYAPTIDLADPIIFGNVRQIYDTRDQWVDVRFTVRPDGSVADVREAGRGDLASGRWIKAATDSIVGRQYLPLARPVDSAGIEKLERFVLTSSLERTTESRIRVRVGTPKLQSVDLTGRDLRLDGASPSTG